MSRSSKERRRQRRLALKQAAEAVEGIAGPGSLFQLTQGYYQAAYLDGVLIRGPTVAGADRVASYAERFQMKSAIFDLSSPRTYRYDPFPKKRERNKP